jgi:hypothetical protein
VSPLYFDTYYGNAIHRNAAISGTFYPPNGACGSSQGIGFFDPTLTTDWLDIQSCGITAHGPLNASLYFSALGGSPATAANLLAVYQGATGLVGVAGIGATNVIGIANSYFYSPYGGLVLSSGIGTCVADNTVTIGNLIGVGTTTAGRCKDLGTVNFSAVSQALQIVGVATTGASAGGTFTLQFFGPGYYGTSVALPATVVQTNQANTYTAGDKQTFQASATTAGFSWGGVTADPSAPVNGDEDYRTDLTRAGIYTGSAWHRFAYTDDVTAVAQGGTGLTTLTAHAVQVGEGTSTPAQVGPDSTTTHFLAAGGASADPGFRAIAAGDLPTTLTGGTTIPNAGMSPQKVDCHTACSPTAAQLSNAMVFNYGQGAASVQITGPTVVDGMNFIMIVGTAPGAYYWRYTSASGTIYLDGSGSGTTYIEFATPAIGNSFSCFSFQTGASTYSLKCTTLAGTPSTS